MCWQVFCRSIESKQIFMLAEFEGCSHSSQPASSRRTSSIHSSEMRFDCVVFCSLHSFILQFKSHVKRVVNCTLIWWIRVRLGHFLSVFSFTWIPGIFLRFRNVARVTSNTVEYYFLRHVLMTSLILTWSERCDSHLLFDLNLSRLRVNAHAEWTRLIRASCATLVKGASARSSRHRSRAPARFTARERQKGERARYVRNALERRGAVRRRTCANSSAVSSDPSWVERDREVWSRAEDLQHDLALRNISTRSVCDFTGKVLWLLLLIMIPLFMMGCQTFGLYWDLILRCCLNGSRAAVSWRYTASDRTHDQIWNQFSFSWKLLLYTSTKYSKFYNILL